MARNLNIALQASGHRMQMAEFQVNDCAASDADGPSEFEGALLVEAILD